MYFVLARVPLYFAAALGGWWLARAIRPVTDLIPGLNVWFDPKFIPGYDFFIPFSLFSALGFILVASFLGSFGFKKVFRFEHETGKLILVSVFWGMAIISYFAIFKREVIFSRMMLAQAMVFTVFLGMLATALLSVLQQILWKKGIGVSSVALVGSESERSEIKSLLERENHFKCVQEIEIGRQSETITADEIWCVTRNPKPDDEKYWRNLSYRFHKPYRFVPGSSAAFAKIDLLLLGGIPVLSPIPSALAGWGQISKRVLDVICSLLALAVLSPILLMIAIIVKLTSKGTIRYSSTRIGRDGEPFQMLKFRSMVQNADLLKEKLKEKNHRQDGPFFKIKNDPRVTPFGSFLRRFSLDELPQLFNVLKGDMSLSGPRPHFEDEIEEFTPELRRILSVRPGITGLSQISGRSDLPFAEEMQLDLFYLENWSFWLDMKILIRTVFVVLRGKGAD